MTLTNGSDALNHPNSRRSELAAALEQAASLLPEVRPMTDFVAMNPLSGLTHLRFDDAMTRAADVYGASGYLDESHYRNLRDDGHIPTHHLHTALDEALGEALGDHRSPTAAGVRPCDVLLADLLTGPPAPNPNRVLRSLAERYREATAGRAAVDAQTVRWCSAYLGYDASRWSHGEEQAGLYRWWRTLAEHDRRLRPEALQLLAEMPTNPIDATVHILNRCAVRDADADETIVAELTALPGWAATLVAHDTDGDGAADLVALRLSLTIAELGWPTEPLLAVRRAASHGPATPGTDPARRSAVIAFHDLPPDDAELAATVDRILAHLHPAQRPAIWQRAHELAFRSTLLDDLDQQPSRAHATAPTAQVVCCIDVRSEGLRRHLETTGPYDTYGFAGFFALPMRWTSPTGGEPIANCPVPVPPAFDVTEAPAGTADTRHLDNGIARMAGSADGRKHAKASPAAPYVYAEAAGWITGPSSALRTLAPSTWTRIANRARRRALTPADTTLDVSAIPLDQQVAIARAAITTMGMSTFAPLVVLCGHTSETSANPYEAGLRCGACGGHGGGPNARVLAHILNDHNVRNALAANSITITADTYVLAAEHDTTTDRVTLLDTHLVPADHRQHLDLLRSDLDIACLGLAEERCRDLPGSRTTTPEASFREVERRAADWAEPYAEWGLAGNAAFLIGPRSMSFGVDLGRRVFLHSYDAALDPTGAALEVIMTAPLVVAHGINAQYHFASTDPDIFGAGTKAVHNPVGDIGILSGATGDLRLGLPRQSLGVGDQLLHEPLRLLAAIEAPLDRIATIIERNSGLHDLVIGGWLPLIARSAADEPWQELTKHGWMPLSHPTS